MSEDKRPCVRRPNWTHCHLVVSAVIFSTDGERFVEGTVVETKTGEIRDPYFYDAADDNWVAAFNLEEMLQFGVVR